jgi:FdhE protein
VPRLDAAEARLAGGIPALTGEPLLDGRTLLSVLRDIARRIGDLEGYQAARPIVEAVERGSSPNDLDLLAEAGLAGVWEEVEPAARRLAVDGYALVTLVDYAARAALRRGAVLLRSVLARAAWSRRSCPACGAPPVISVRTGKEGERFLHCGRCGTGWPYPRLRCAGCGEGNHRRLDNLHVAGEADFRRVEVCETCKGYLKSIAALDAPGADEVLRLDLETAGLDFVAVEHGYRRIGAGPRPPALPGAAAGQR